MQRRGYIKLTNRSRGVSIDDLNNNTVGCTNKEENTQKNHSTVQQVDQLLHKAALPVVAVAVEPQEARKTHGERSKT